MSGVGSLLGCIVSDTVSLLCTALAVGDAGFNIGAAAPEIASPSLDDPRARWRETPPFRFILDVVITALALASDLNCTGSSPSALSSGSSK